MNTIKLMVIAFLLTGCGAYEKRNCYAWGVDCSEVSEGTPGTPVQPAQRGPIGPTGFSCSVAQNAAGATISCEDGTSATILNGARGIDGKDGETVVGPQGEAGVAGTAGADGQPGTSCTVVQTGTGATVSCGDGTSADITNGIDGQIGPVGPAGTPAIIEIIDPCGDDPGQVDEVLFRLSTGEITAWYESIGLSILGNGTYRTTDHSRCVFTIIDGTVSW